MEMLSHADKIWCDNICDFRLIEVREDENSPIERIECLSCGDRDDPPFDNYVDICVRGLMVCKECYQSVGRSCRIQERYHRILRGRPYRVTAKMLEREAEHPEAKIGAILWQ